MKRYSKKLFPFNNMSYLFQVYCIVCVIFLRATDQSNSIIPLWLIYHDNQQSISFINTAGISFSKNPIHMVSHKIKIGTIKYRASEVDAFIEACIKADVLPLPAQVNYPANIQSRSLELLWQAVLRGHEPSLQLIKNLEDCIATYKLLKSREINSELECSLRVQSIWRMAEISSADKRALDIKCENLCNLGFVQREYTIKIIEETFYRQVISVHPFLSIKGLAVWCQKEGLLFDHFERVRSH